MKTKTFGSYSEARNYVIKLTESYAIILDQHLISHDAQIEMWYLDGIDEDAKEYGFTYEYFIAIRTKGVEGDEHKKNVIDTIKKLNDTTLCEIRFIKEQEQYVVAYKQNQLNF